MVATVAGTTVQETASVVDQSSASVTDLPNTLAEVAAATMNVENDIVFDPIRVRDVHITNVTFLIKPSKETAPEANIWNDDGVLNPNTTTIMEDVEEAIVA